MYKGILFALAACFLWGLIFVIPLFMPNYGALEVALGIYFFYGIVSLLLFAQAQLSGRCHYSLKIWKTALLFALLTSMGYYNFLVLSLRYSSPAICALILGLSPITIAFYGNWRLSEGGYQKLMGPTCLILLGLIIVNVPQIIQTETPSTFLLGLLCALVALITWSWFAVANSRFLKNTPEVKSSDWSTIMGVATLFWALVFGLLLLMFDQIEIQKYTVWNRELTLFLGGCAVLGLLYSWLGAYLWNKACIYLPVSFAGQLMIFETIFGILFFYLLEQRVPPIIESIGIGLFCVAVIYAIGSFSLQEEPVLEHS